MKIKSLLSWLSSGVVSINTGYAQTSLIASEDEVFIFGESHERREQSRAGSSVIVRPTEETRFDNSAHFKLDPSLSGLDQGRSSSGGFSLPLFRGHDVRASHIFLDGVALQDPFTGLPLVEDIELRAFGELRIHKGLAPWDVSVASPGGVIQFLSRPVVESVVSAGGTAGDVYGSSAWGQAAGKAESIAMKAYGRRSASRGDYVFYSDNQTIRNSEDDEVRRQGNNESNATVASLSGTAVAGVSSFKWFGWNQDSERGIPVRGQSSGGSARLNARTSVASMTFDRWIGEDFQIGIGAQHLATRRMVRDPEANVSLLVIRSLETKTNQLSLSIRRNSDRIAWLGECRRAVLQVEQSGNMTDPKYEPKAGQSICYLGSKLKITELLTVELKADQSRADADASSSQNYGVTGLIRGGEFDLWLQVAQHARRPSLLERGGNGGEIKASENLISEGGEFFEAGVRHETRWRGWLGKRSLAMWADLIRDRIRIDPVSATQWKAGNRDFERYRGVEAREHWWVGRLDLEGAVSLTRAEQDDGKLLPRIPLWQGVGAVGFRVSEAWKARSTSRYSGRVYDDYGNTTEIGDWWLHDLSIDRFDANSGWSLGVAVLNFTNVQSLPVRDVETGQTESRIALESQTRNPLPGRQWVVSARVEL